MGTKLKKGSLCWRFMDDESKTITRQRYVSYPSRRALQVQVHFNSADSGVITDEWLIQFIKRYDQEIDVLVMSNDISSRHNARTANDELEYNGYKVKMVLLPAYIKPTLAVREQYVLSSEETEEDNLFDNKPTLATKYHSYKSRDKILGLHIKKSNKKSLDQL